VIGSVLGILLALIVSWVGIDMPAPPNMSQGYIATIRITLGTFLGAFSIGVLSTLLACLWPAWRVGRKPIVDALRQNI
jgi:putative ABC transport system permease protein